MNLEALQALGAQDEVPGSLVPRADAAQPAHSVFTGQVAQGLQDVNQQLLVAQADLQQLAVGAPVNLHQVMLHLEESRIGLQLLLQVRNRVLEAYQDVMKMPV
jgi:flagellar hook-basal body complex protein FliE